MVYENYCGHIWHPLPWCEVIYTTPVITGMENLPKRVCVCVRARTCVCVKEMFVIHKCSHYKAQRKIVAVPNKYPELHVFVTLHYVPVQCSGEILTAR